MKEANRLLRTPVAQARSQYSDRVARACLIRDDEARKLALQFNAELATVLRLKSTNGKGIW